MNRKVATRMLEKMNMSVDIATNGQQALDQLALHDYDLILMDCQMPVLDGYATTEQIRAAEAATGHRQIIIALSANSENEYRQRCLDAGMDDYLAKPFKMESLAALLAHWLPAAPLQQANA